MRVSVSQFSTKVKWFEEVVEVDMIYQLLEVKNPNNKKYVYQTYPIVYGLFINKKRCARICLLVKDAFYNNAGHRCYKLGIMLFQYDQHCVAQELIQNRQITIFILHKPAGGTFHQMDQKFMLHTPTCIVAGQYIILLRQYLGSRSRTDLKNSAGNIFHAQRL